MIGSRQIDAGYYVDDSEDYVHDLIQREQERNAATEAIRIALTEGENSGEAKAFDASAFRERMRATHG